MFKIERDKAIEFTNLLSLRKRVTNIQTELGNMKKLLDEKEACKAGPLITAVFNNEEINGEQVLDMEIMIPVDKKMELSIELSDRYKFKDKFYLVHALYLRYEGNLSGLDKAYQLLNEYIQINNLQQITTYYSLNIKEPQCDEFGNIDNNVIVDIYTGINPSIL